MDSSLTLPEVQIELYDHGKGPRHTFKTKLQGWEANRLDLEMIQNIYNLEAVYAYSITTGRGQKLGFHPRNGLSLVSYSRKPGMVIRLDSEAKTWRKVEDAIEEEAHQSPAAGAAEYLIDVNIPAAYLLIGRMCFLAKEIWDSTPVRRTVLRFAVGALLVSLIFLCFFSNSRPAWFYKLQGLVGGGIGWIVAFIVLIAAHLTGWPFRRKNRGR